MPGRVGLPRSQQFAAWPLPPRVLCDTAVGPQRVQDTGPSPASPRTPSVRGQPPSTADVGYAAHSRCCSAGILHSAPGLAMYRRPGCVGGRGSRHGAGGTPRAGAGAQVASGSRPWCHLRGCRARRWRPRRGRWPGRRRVARHTGRAVPRSAGPGPGPARSPRRQCIEPRSRHEGSVSDRPDHAGDRLAQTAGDAATRARAASRHPTTAG
jgi:hypothetical protein